MQHTSKQNTMTLDEEMKIWEARMNDPFGKTLSAIVNTEKTEFGLCSNLLDQCKAAYALDGNRSFIVKKIKHILTEYDMIDDFKASVRNLEKLVA